jgi:hypothetical protein
MVGESSSMVTVIVPPVVVFAVADADRHDKGRALLAAGVG